jgi:RNA polymerase sigma-70 factor (ECF subfamily)
VEDLIREAVRRLRSAAHVEESSRVLADRLRPRLLAYFQKRRFADADAEELVQETLRRVFRGIEGLANVDCFMGWLYRVARNVALSASAAADSPAPVSLDGPVSAEIADAGSPTPLDALLAAERLERVWDAVEALPPQQKQCLILRVVREMSYEEIAVVLRLSARTVRNHLREARARLRRKLGEE